MRPYNKLTQQYRQQKKQQHWFHTYKLKYYLTTERKAASIPASKKRRARSKALCDSVSWLRASLTSCADLATETSLV